MCQVSCSKGIVSRYYSTGVYARNENTDVFITVPGATQIQIQFTVFNIISNNPTCEDFISIYKCNIMWVCESSPLAIFCTSGQLNTIIVQSETAKIKWKTSNYTTGGNGWIFNFSSIVPICAQCTPGTYTLNASEICDLCQPGTYNDVKSSY